MKDFDLDGVQWRKSSYSSANGQCVEVAELPGVVALRDSKNPQGPALAFGPEGFAAFVNGVAGEAFSAPRC
ncbi:DUF397 domain-containing protein [Streptomyces sp. ODS05-4]|uniref:DUF397 domain-containing protein n=1 Tax=Streptomyces sp. ODS05-4 TaxID=2944939 RepID=UPI00210B37A1|nr:DUF397 domain-containing protein [Streptomyces sp. ODS05-4]